MGVTWRTPEQSAFLEGYIATYLRSVGEEKEKEFWAEVTKAWFERFPLDEPSTESIQEGSDDKATAKARTKRIKVSKTTNNLYP